MIFQTATPFSFLSGSISHGGERPHLLLVSGTARDMSSTRPPARLPACEFSNTFDQLRNGEGFKKEFSNVRRVSRDRAQKRLILDQKHCGWRCHANKKPQTNNCFSRQRGSDGRSRRSAVISGLRAAYETWRPSPTSCTASPQRLFPASHHQGFGVKFMATS